MVSEAEQTETVPTPPKTLQDREMNSLDRCDRCGAQAYHRAYRLNDETNNEQELLFCNHHGKAHRDALEGINNWKWQDNSKTLFSGTPGGSA